MKINKILIFLLILTFLLASCSFNEGGPEASLSINDSKKNNLFITECVIPQKIIFESDSLTIKIEEAWIEKFWNYSHTFFLDTIASYDSIYQLVLKINDLYKVKGIQEYLNINPLNFKAGVQIKEVGMVYQDIPLLLDTFRFAFQRYRISYTYKSAETISTFEIIKKK